MDATKSSPFSERKSTVPVETLVFAEKSRDKRCEIDTSAPFESVKEAVNRFGGSAIWNSQLRMLFLPEKRHCFKESEVVNVEEQQTDKLEKNLSLNELEVSQRIMKEENSEFNKFPASSSVNFHPISQKENENHFTVHEGTIPGQSSGSILDDLDLAKKNLSRTSCDLTKIRAFIEALYNEIDSERTIQEKTPEKLSSLGSIVSFLEEDLKKTTLKLQITKEASDNGNRDPAVISREIDRLRWQAEQFRQTAAAAKSEASNLTSEIDKMKACIKTAEIRKLAANKMEEAAKAAEAVASARIKDIVSSNSSGMALPVKENVLIVIPEHEEQYDSSTKKTEASSLVDDQTSDLLKLELLAKVKEAATEVKNSRKVLEDAVNLLETASSGKLADEGALWRWPEYNEKIQSSSTKHKNYTYSKMLEINGFNLATHSPKSGFKDTLSIGQILSKKLMGLDEYEYAIQEICESSDENVKVSSLGQILSRKPGLLPPLLVGRFVCKQQTLKGKRKKIGFLGLY